MDLARLTIVTFYPGGVAKYTAEQGVEADEIVRLDGAVERSLKLGVAQVIADVIETGTALRHLGPEVIGEPTLCIALFIVSPFTTLGRLADIGGSGVGVSYLEEPLRVGAQVFACGCLLRWRGHVVGEVADGQVCECRLHYGCFDRGGGAIGARCEYPAGSFLSTAGSVRSQGEDAVTDFDDASLQVKGGIGVRCAARDRPGWRENDMRQSLRKVPPQRGESFEGSLFPTTLAHVPDRIDHGGQGQTEADQHDGKRWRRHTDCAAHGAQRGAPVPLADGRRVQPQV
ncbi:hypothetical protein AMK30_21225 [Streptomyces sp. CB02460]|nr:hypothetical protein AMK30_21225 [Streptomyces sp. CB02460]